METKKVGLQIFSIRDIYFRDPVEAFKLISECGYDAVEMSGSIVISAEELKKILDNFGLECCGWQAPWDYMSRSDLLEMFALYNKVIGNKFLILPELPNELRQDEYAWLKASYKITEVAARLKKYGMRTGIHSHKYEFRPIEDGEESPRDILMQNTCGNVVLQLDTGDAYAAGINPAEILRKYPGRAQTIHIKPYSNTKGRNAVIGDDDIDWEEVVKLCSEQGKTEYFIIEYEEDDAKTGIKTCIENFRKYIL